MADAVPVSPGASPAADHGPWRALRAHARRHGHAVCHGRLGDWALAPGRPAQELLGADWPRYRALGDASVRARLLGSRRLLHRAVAEFGGTEPGAVVVERGRYGRPFVREPAGLDAGVSHTRDLLVAGVSSGGRIGVDAEALDRPLLVPGMAERMCHPEELAELRRLDSAEVNGRLVRLWTLKEAYAKALGVGLRLDFSEVRFTEVRHRSPFGEAAWTCASAPGWRFSVDTVDTADPVGGRYAVAQAVGPAVGP